MLILKLFKSLKTFSTNFSKVLIFLFSIFTLEIALKGGESSLIAAIASQAPNSPLAGNAGLPQFDSSKYTQQLFWLIISFGSLYAFLSYIAIPKLRQIKTDRNNRILNNIEQSAKIKKDIDKINSLIVQKKQQLKKDEEQISEDIVNKVKTLTKQKKSELEASKKEEQSAFDEKFAAYKKNTLKNIDKDSLVLSKLILNKLNLDFSEEIIEKIHNKH
ncbi:ATP synthase subunit b 2 [Candidatus Hepatincolaceae symbiont of Richtersius coronifer]